MPVDVCGEFGGGLDPDHEQQQRRPGLHRAEDGRHDQVPVFELLIAHLPPVRLLAEVLEAFPVVWALSVVLLIAFVENHDAASVPLDEYHNH